MSKYKIKDLFPVLLLICALGYTIILVVTSNILLQSKHYVAALFVALTLITYFYKRQYYKKVLLLTLVLGTLNVLAFTPNITIITFGIDSTGISFQPFSFLILLIFLFLNKRRVATILGIESREHLDPTAIYLDEAKFEKLREKYSDRSVEELNAIIIDSTYSLEAVEAAKSLINEKTVVN